MTKVAGERPSAIRDFKNFLEARKLNKEWLIMKQGSKIHSLGVCENGDVTEAFQNILRETQNLKIPGKTESGSELCSKK